jgi:hypothetical protein
MAFIQRYRIAVSFVLGYALARGRPMERLLRAGRLLAPLIVVTLTERLSGLKAPTGMPARPRHRTIAEREELR